MSVGEFAVELGVSVAEIEDLLTGKEAIGREIACQLEQVTSIPSDSWIRFELKYREDSKRMSVGSEEPCTSSIHDELMGLFKQGGRSWVEVYALMEHVSEAELYRPEYNSFSAWLKDEAARCGISESLLWHRKSAGDFYKKWADGKSDVPSLAEGEHLSELNLHIWRASRIQMGNSRRCSLEPIDPWRSSSFSLPRPLPDTTCGPLPRSRE